MRQFGSVMVVPMYHPAAALHQPSLRQAVLDDFAKLPELLKNPIAVEQAVEDDPDEASDEFEQLNLF